MASGVLTTTALTFAANLTVSAFAAAITALGNGWSAQAVGDSGGDYGLWPSADFYVPTSFGDGLASQGNLTARGQNAELKMHTYELAGYQFDQRGWLAIKDPETVAIGRKPHGDCPVTGARAPRHGERCHVNLIDRARLSRERENRGSPRMGQQRRGRCIEGYGLPKAKSGQVNDRQRMPVLVGDKTVARVAGSFGFAAA